MQFCLHTSLSLRQDSRNTNAFTLNFSSLFQLWTCTVQCIAYLLTVKITGTKMQKPGVKMQVWPYPLSLKLSRGVLSGVEEEKWALCGRRQLPGEVWNKWVHKIQNKNIAQERKGEEWEKKNIQRKDTAREKDAVGRQTHEKGEETSLHPFSQSPANPLG